MNPNQQENNSIFIVCCSESIYEDIETAKFHVKTNFENDDSFRNKIINNSLEIITYNFDDYSIDDKNTLNIKNIIFFLHSKDFIGMSASHYNVDLKQIEPEIKAIKHAFSNKGINLSILWFKRETQSCTVYNSLDKALKEYDKDQDSAKLQDALKSISKFHDSAERKAIRTNLFGILKESTTDQVRKVIVTEALNYQV